MPFAVMQTGYADTTPPKKFLQLLYCNVENVYVFLDHK